MNAVGAGILVILISIILFASRRWAVVGVMAGVIYLTQGQAIDLFGVNLYAIRVLGLCSFCRVIARKEFEFSKINGIDKLLLFTYGYRTLAFILNSNGSPIGAISLMLDVTFSYFAFRGLIRGIDDLVDFLRVFSILLGPYVALVSIEMLTMHNPFSYFGAVPESWVLRGDRLRCMGSFRHPSLFGTLGASFLPLYIGLVFTKNNRFNATMGIGFCLGIIFLSNSGGPLSFALIAVVGWLLWIIRKKMFLVRRMIAITFVLLVFFMKAPIYYLPAKLSAITGGDGWHRSYLMEVAFRHFGEWWFAGMPILRTKDWFPYLVSTGGADITNYYLDFGIEAGFVAMVIFVFFLIKLFQILGQALTIVRSNSTEPSESEFLLWGLGVMLAGHLFNWIGITYFDQTYVIWFMQVATISTIAQASTKTSGVPEPIYPSKLGMSRAKKPKSGRETRFRTIRPIRR
ncbi:MAG: hypothetical protein IPN42_03900 [Methylococcaceae bacterium]|nr:hypothetical protein [Methylococcaceae bacterium]